MIYIYLLSPSNVYTSLNTKNVKLCTARRYCCEINSTISTAESASKHVQKCRNLPHTLCYWHQNTHKVLSNAIKEQVDWLRQIYILINKDHSLVTLVQTFMENITESFVKKKIPTWALLCKTLHRMVEIFPLHRKQEDGIAGCFKNWWLMDFFS